MISYNIIFRWYYWYITWLTLSIDICLHDTYYIIGHFHLVLSLGTLLSLLLGLLQHIQYYTSNYNSS